MIAETARWHAVWQIDKYNEDGIHYEHVDIDGNCLLTEGITTIWTLLIGGAGTVFSTANARLGVGTSSTAADPSQTDLLAGAVYAAMDATYPQVAGATITFRSTFDGATGNQVWAEFVVDNGAGAGKTLNRKVSAQGTKTSGQTWVLTLTVTLA